MSGRADHRPLALRPRADHARPRRDPLPRQRSSPTPSSTAARRGSRPGSRARPAPRRPARDADRQRPRTTSRRSSPAPGSASRCSRSPGGSRRPRSRTSSTTPSRRCSSPRPSTRSSREAAGARRRDRADRRPDARGRRARSGTSRATTTRCSSSTRPGTTGKPKGALLTHANCFWTNLSFDRTTSLRDDDVVLQVLPQFHVGGWNVQPLLAWWKGATVVLEPSFDPARALQLIAEQRVTTMMGVPATYLFLSQEPGFATADLSSLRLAVVGGAPMPESLLETWQRARGRDRPGLRADGGGAERPLPAAGGRDAASSASPASRTRTSTSRCATPRRARSSTAPRPASSSSAARTSSPATGATPRRRRPPFADGWLSTGDVAERDEEGFYRIAGRIKDMVISGGENVYPAEIEDVLHAHPAVRRGGRRRRPRRALG